MAPVKSIPLNIRKLVLCFCVITSALTSKTHAQFGYINTIAGNGTPGFSGDGGAATAAELNNPSDVFKDASGNIYIADNGNNRIRKINTSGIISTIAGTGTAGYTGDGGLATAATLNAPNRVFVDISGNIYIADQSNNVIRKINTAGIISTIAGTSTAGFSGDGGAATSAELSSPTGVAVDGTGNIFISDLGNSRIRKVNTSGIISTYAGGGSTGFTVDGVAATSISLCSQEYVSVDNSGNIYITNRGCWHFLKVTPAGLIYNVAGAEAASYSGDCGPADSADVRLPYGITPDNTGNIYLCPRGNYRVRRVNSLGYINTIAGNGTAGYSGDGGPAVSAEISSTIYGIYADMSGNIYFADMGNNRIRLFTSTPYADTLNMCVGATDTLHDSTGSGTWISGNTSIATVDSVTGVVTGISAGTAIITYNNIACPELVLINVLSPVVNLGPDTTICGGGSITLASADSYTVAPVTYAWSTGATMPSIAISTSGTYWLTVTEAGCVSPTDTVHISLLPSPPVPSCASNSPVCSGGALNLTATDTSGVIYSWSGPGGYASTVQNPTIDPAYTAASGYYTVTATSAGCSALGSVSVFIDSCNMLHLPDTLHACTGTIDTLAATITGTDSVLSILWSPLTGLSSATVLDPLLTVGAPGWYDVTLESLIPDNLVFNGSFSLGNTGFTSSYTYQPPPSTILLEGDYSVYTDPFGVHSGFSTFGDHTTGTGDMLIINGGSTASDVWCQTISVTPGTNYDFSAWFADCSSVTVGADVPIIQFKINGVLIGSPTSITAAVGTWMNFNSTWNSGTATTATICIYDENTTPAGNDFVIDDISFEPVRITTDSIYVAASPVPVVNLGDDTAFCAGSTLTLRSSDTYTSPSYLWSTGSSAPSVNVTTSGAYWLAVTVAGCTGSDTVNVTVNAIPPPPIAGPDGPACSGTTLDLTAHDDSTTATLSWTGPNGFTALIDSPTITFVTTAATGIYSLTATLNGCTSAMTTEAVLVNLTPDSVYAGSNSPICRGDTLRFTAADSTTTVTYFWTSSTGFTSTEQNPVIYDADTTASGIYMVTATSTSSTCSSTRQVAVTVNAIPTLLTINSNSPVCSGSSLLLGSTFSYETFGTFRWTGPNGYAATGASASRPGVVTADSGTYSVTETRYGCTSPTYTISVTIDSTPATPLALSSTPVCVGDTIKLTATDVSPGVTYSWTGPGIIDTIAGQNVSIASATLADSGLYTVKVTIGVCVDSAGTTVSITRLPTIAPASNSPICSGDTLFLYGNAEMGSLYDWNGPYSFTTLSPDPILANTTTEYSGVYTITATLNNCTASAYDTVLVKQTPPPPFVSWLTYCQYYPAPPLMANDDSITWYVYDSLNSVKYPNAPTPSTALTGATFYFAGQTVNGCPSGIDSIQVTVNPNPTVTVTPADTAVCPGASYVLRATDTDAIAYYHWYPAIYLSDTNTANVKVTPETNASYTVVASNQYGCSDTAAAAVTVHPAALIYLGDSVTLYPGQTYTMSPSTNCTTFEWFPPAGMSSSVIPNPVASPGVSTKYILYGQTVDGCTASDSINIHVSPNSLIAVPNAFSPGNGANSEFKVIRNGEATLNHFRIYNGWGQKVFETNDINAGWDGTFNGTPQPFDVYVYEIEAVTSSGQDFRLQGNVTLVR